MQQVVDTGAFIHDMYDCLFPNSVFSIDGVFYEPYFVQPVLELWMVATYQMTHHRLHLPLHL